MDVIKMMGLLGNPKLGEGLARASDDFADGVRTARESLRQHQETNRLLGLIEGHLAALIRVSRNMKENV